MQEDFISEDDDFALLEDDDEDDEPAPSNIFQIIFQLYRKQGFLIEDRKWTIPEWLFFLFVQIPVGTLLYYDVIILQRDYLYEVSNELFGRYSIAQQDETTYEVYAINKRFLGKYETFEAAKRRFLLYRFQRLLFRMVVVGLIYFAAYGMYMTFSH